MNARLACLLLTVLVCVSACGSAAATARPGPTLHACRQQAAANGPNFKVVAAVETTVGWARLMVPDHEDNLLWPSLAADDPAAMCYLDGPIAKSPPMGRPFERELVVVAGGQGVMLMAGYREDLALPGS